MGMGPNSDDCKDCIPNAHENAAGHCVCESWDHSADQAHNGFWSGDFCTQWNGTCAHGCASCDNGYAPDQCSSCLPNAYFNSNGVCECHPDWTAYDCSEYIGECDPRCNGCSAPGNGGCDSCTLHAHDEGGFCLCDNDFTGEDCSLYQADCDDKCLGCYDKTPLNRTADTNHDRVHCVK